MRKIIALTVMVVALTGCGLPDLTADKPVERPAKSVTHQSKPTTSTTSTTLLSDWDLRPTTTVAEVEPDATSTVAPADAVAPSVLSTGTAGNTPVAPSPSSGSRSSSSGGTSATPAPALANQPSSGARTGGDTGTCAYPGFCTSDPHRNGEVGKSGQVAGTIATPVGAGGE